MKQLALDIGLAPGPTLERFFAGPNTAALQHLAQAVASTNASVPVPTYLWGESGSGKTHLLHAVREALREQGASVGWRDARSKYAPHFDEKWSAVILDDVHLYSTDLPLREDLRSRLGWGHVFHLQMLGDAPLRAVLRQQADARGVHLGEDVMDYMLKRFSRDLGSLMALLDRLDRHALRTQRALTIPLLKDMLDSE